jgi:hypothetical protein
MDFEFFEVPVRLLGTRFTLGAMFLAEVPLVPEGVDVTPSTKGT